MQAFISQTKRQETFVCITLNSNAYLEPEVSYHAPKSYPTKIRNLMIPSWMKVIRTSSGRTEVVALND